MTDDGIGMEPEILANVFEPFFTTKEIGKGTGLGLATVHGIVTQNRGFITVRTSPGSGSTFNVYLPRHAAPVEAPVLEQREAPRGEETILVVEDDAPLLRMVTRILARHGYTVLSAACPSEAVRVATEYAASIDLLLTDVVMPEMNGRDLSLRLLALRPALRVLFTSGYTADAIGPSGVLEPGVHFLQKPFSVQRLSAKVREVLDSDLS